MRLCDVEGCERSHEARGYCHGHLARFYRGHSIGGPFPASPLDRFIARIEVDGDCWVWTGGTDGDGRYGMTKADGRHVPAHRWAYEHLTGQQIPDGFELDHLCRRTLCVNPDHLEPVTHQENVRRGALVKDHCRRGHLYTRDNTSYASNGGRVCKACRRLKYALGGRNARWSDLGVAS